MTDRSTRAKQLQEMVTTSDGRAEIHRLARVIHGVTPGASMSGMFIGQMIADILSAEFPDSSAPLSRMERNRSP